MTHIGIVVNETKDINFKMTRALITWIEKNNLKALLCIDIAKKVNRYDIGCSMDELYKKSDFVIVLGGDGTLLSTAREISCCETPIFGVNMGHLGFITEVEIDDVFDSLKKIISGKYKIEERLMLETNVIDGNHKSETFYCLNDFGIAKGTLSRIITFMIYINEDYVDTFHADGIIVSTPTGSTAYSLSAGGPIISPNVFGILITPVCPHSFNSRALIVSNKDKITIIIADNNQEIYLTVDGQEGYKLKKGDRVIVSEAPFKAKLIKVANRSFYDVLRTKIKERS